ncbi:hypothetical protein QCA50_011457 [Cerrena zonata]|uniref:F-box domain-containing protein n=1 Tax=Cerrena zonata TaxID=2478898 RepID=A0AAW0FWM0_9APHY
MNPRRMMLHSLPPELLTMIFGSLSQNDKYVVVRVSTTFYLITTPLLWTSVLLSRLSKVSDFLDAILRPECKYANMLRSFEIIVLRGTKWHDNSDTIEAEGALYNSVKVKLPEAVLRMIRLETFRVYNTLYRHSLTSIVTPLISISTLKSLWYLFPILDDDRRKLELPRAHFPNLERLHLTSMLGNLNLDIVKWIRNLVNDHAPHIRDLQLQGTLPSEIIRNDTSWPLLETLQLDQELYPHLVSIMPNIKKLIVPTLNSAVGFRPLPKLEIVRARSTAVALGSLLTGCPVHTLELDGVIFNDDRVDADFSLSSMQQQDNSHIIAAVEQLKTASVPTRALAFGTYQPNVSLLASMLSSLNTLEHLKISFVKDWNKVPDFMEDFGKQVLLYLPHLESLAFDDRRRMSYARGDTGCFTNSRNVQMQLDIIRSWADKAYCPLLGRVAFTSLFAWNKLDGGWINEEIA